MVSTKCYQKQEMLSIAHDHSFKVTEHLFKCWVEKGLLGEAKREWLGRGRGSVSWWSQAQCDLFLELLAHRQKQHNPPPIGALCTIPIGKWLYLGEEAGGVSLSQVRRAMATWMEYQRRFSPKHITHCATQMLHRFGSPKVEGKRRLIKHLTELGVFTPRLTPQKIDELTDPEQLQYELIPAFSSLKKLQKKISEGPDMGRYLCMFTPILFRALQDPEVFLDQPDILWEWARVVHLLTLGGYLRDQPSFASDLNAGRLIANATFDHLFAGAGFNLLRCLGAVQKKEYWPHHSILNPERWLYGEVLAPVIQPKALFTLPLLFSGIYIVKYEFCIRQNTMVTRPICVMLIRQFFDNKSGDIGTSDIHHTFEKHEIEMTDLKDFFHFLSSWLKQKEQEHRDQ